MWTRQQALNFCCSIVLNDGAFVVAEDQAGQDFIFHSGDNEPGVSKIFSDFREMKAKAAYDLPVTKQTMRIMRLKALVMEYAKSEKLEFVWKIPEQVVNTSGLEETLRKIAESQHAD